MLFLEQNARLLLVIHLALGVATVAAATHLVLWLRKRRRGDLTRIAATRRFALISFALFAMTFVVGNLIYPAYKVRVRVEYLDNPTEVNQEHQRAVERHTKARTAYSEFHNSDLAAQDPPAMDASPAKSASKIARWFDVKEHWSAFGLVFAAACALLLHAGNPKKHGAPLQQFVFAFAIGAMASAWFAAIVGAVTTSAKAVG